MKTEFFLANLRGTQKVSVSRKMALKLELWRCYILKSFRILIKNNSYVCGKGNNFIRIISVKLL